MSDETKPSANGSGDLMRLWFDMASRAAEACQAWTGAVPTPDALRQDRANLMKVWSDYWEQYLRSPSFLETQQRSRAGALDLQRQARDYLAWLHHQFQVPSSQDIDQLMIGMRRLKEDLRDQLEEIGDQLENLASQVSALTERVSARGQESSARKTPPPADTIAETETA
jgi:hypothetical protein